MWKTDCVYCGCSIPCAIVQQADLARVQGVAHSGQILERQLYQEMREPGMTMSMNHPQPCN
jgi:hypothetical protein